MKSKYAKNIVSKMIALTFVGSLAPSIVFANTDTDALYDSRAELESAQANFEEAQIGYESSIEELQLAKNNHAEVAEKNVKSAARIRKEIANLQSEQKANIKLATKLSGKVVILNKQIQKNEADEKRAQSRAAVAADKLVDARTAFNRSLERKNSSVQSLIEVKARLSQTNQDLKSKYKDVASAKKAEKHSAISLKNAQAQYKKVQAQAAKEMKSLNKQLKQAQSRMAKNEKRTEAFRNKKQRLEASLREKRQRLSESKGREKKILARVGSN